MRAPRVVAFIAFVCYVSADKPDEIEDRIGGMSVYQGDDASAILQEAFAQAGVDLGGPIVPIAPAAPRLSLVQRLRNMRLPLPNLSAFSRRKVTPVPNMLIPLMPAGGHGMPGVKTGRVLNTKAAHLGTAHVKDAAFIPAYNHDNKYPPSSQFGSNNEAAVIPIPQYTFPQESEVVKETLTASPSFHSLKTSVSDAVVRITAPPTPMTTQVDKQIPGNNRTANHSLKSMWIPSSHYFGGFKPIPATSSVHAPVSVPTAARTYEKSNSLSAEETKRVSFFESLDQEKSASDHNSRRKDEAKSMDIWRLNDSQVQQSVSDLLRQAAVRSDNKSQNKLFPITPAMLLEQMARMTSNRTAHECKNKDLGWCDYSETYPEHFVLAVIKECRDIIERMYVEVPQNLADFDDYVPFSPIASNKNNSDMAKRSTDNAATWSWAGYRNKNNALCDADRKFVRPSVAQDITGRWFVIVQSSLYHQQVPTELCRNPGGVCNNISQCGLTARCVQRFNTQLLVSIDLDKESDCPTMRLYRFPSGCVCDNASYY